jgi:hypothetical protein
VQIRPLLQAIGHRRVQLDVVEKLARTDLFGDADRLLVHDPPGPDVLMPDLAVAHRPLRQADVEPAGADQRVRILGHQPVGDGVPRQLDGVGVVPLRVGILSPPVADDQDERTLDGGGGGGHDEPFHE